MVKKTKTLDDDPFAFLDEEPGRRTADEKPAARLGKGMPTEVPILVANDMAYAGDAGDGGRRAIDWWLYWTFTSGVRAYKRKYPDEQANQVLREVLSERYGKKVKCLWTFMEYQEKHKDVSLAWLAACWNEMLRRLGYGIPQRRCQDPGR